MSSIWGVDVMNACQCASIRPGIRVRPPPSIAVTVSFGSTVIGAVDIRSMVWPMTRTLHGADTMPLLPSKTRTFWNKVAGPVAGGAEVASCPALAWESPSKIAPRTTDEDTQAFIDMPLIHLRLGFPTVNVTAPTVLLGNKRFTDKRKADCWCKKAISHPIPKLEQERRLLTVLREARS